MTEPRLVELTETWECEADCCGGPGPNWLTVEITNGGGDPYIVIKTERWAIDGTAELDSILRNALERVKRHEPKQQEAK